MTSELITVKELVLRLHLSPKLILNVIGDVLGNRINARDALPSDIYLIVVLWNAGAIYLSKDEWEKVVAIGSNPHLISVRYVLEHVYDYERGMSVNRIRRDVSTACVGSFGFE